MLLGISGYLGENIERTRESKAKHILNNVTANTQFYIHNIFDLFFILMDAYNRIKDNFYDKLLMSEQISH